MPMGNEGRIESEDHVPGPYESEQQINDLIAAKDDAKLSELYRAYMAYFAANQCEPIGSNGWTALGAYFLSLAIAGSHRLRQTRAEFEAATAGMLKQPIPAWITAVEYVQTDPNGTYYLALPPKEFALQALLHTKNPQSKGTDYVVPPIYTDIDPTKTPEEILNTRICDYVISHCG